MKKFKNILLHCFIGVSIGLLNGLFGGGGGIVAVPALTNLLKYPNKNAHATAILLILPITVASATIYVSKNYFNWWQVLSISIGVFIGGFGGAKLLNKLNAKTISIIFAIVMLAAGIKLVI